MQVLTFIKELQQLRGTVPSYILFSDIGPRTLIITREELANSPDIKEVDIILHSPGGQPSDAYRLIRTFREKYEVVNVIIPFWAKSAATLFAFGGSRIVLHEFGELGPIDVQIKKNNDDNFDEAWVSALNVQSGLAQIEARSRAGMIEMFKTLRSDSDIRLSKKQLADMLSEYSAKFYIPLLEKIDTVEIGTMSRYLDIGRMYAKRILKYYSETSNDKLEELLDFLVYECPDHGYVIDHKILQEFLPHVIKADQEPFNPAYYKKLEELSIHLMKDVSIANIELTGFVDNIVARLQDSAKVNLDDSKTSNKNSKTSKAKRTRTKPNKNSGPKKP